MGLTSTNVANLKKKQDTVDKVKESLEQSALIFTFRADGLEVNQLRSLRDAMPEGTPVTLIKNRLMKRAIEGNEKWDHIDDLLHYSNYWAFVSEDNMRASFEAVQKLLKDTGRDKPEHPLGDSKGVRGGVFGGEYLDAEGVVKVSKLPTKIELITQIAKGINLVPTKLARGINLVPTKVGRAIKLAKADEDEGSD